MVLNSPMKSNVAQLYTPNVTGLEPEVELYHKSDSISMMVTRLDPSQLLFNMANSRKLLMARLKIKYYLYPSFEAITLLDSASSVYYLYMHNMHKSFMSYSQIRTPIKRDYLLAIEITDMNKGRSYKSYQYIRKSGATAAQDYAVYKQSNQELMFGKIIQPDSAFVLSSKNKAIKDSYVSYYSDIFNFPAPPFSTTKLGTKLPKPDSVFVYHATDTLDLLFKRPGLMFFSNNKDSLYGTSVRSFGLHYPKLKKADEMIEPLAFLSSLGEYRAMKVAKNKKNSLDDFWLKAAGNMPRAKELIRIYYNRVQYANRFFTSFTEGWRTDRGMVYTVFGPPGTIFKTDTSERWIYGTGYSSMPLEFVFNQYIIPLSDNHFILDRKPEYQPYWRRAVNSWRKGKVYSYMQN